MKECDFLVIGAGIAGSAAAFRLAAHGKVIAIERESSAGYHTTGRSAAQFLESYGNFSTRCLARGSRDFLLSPPKGFVGAPLLSPRPVLHIARSDQMERLRAFHDESAASIPGTTLVDESSILEMIPAIRPGYAKAGLLEAQGMDIDVHALHQGFLAGAKRQGAEIVLDAEIEALESKAGRWHARTRQGDFVASAVINAAGAWCDEVARMAGAKTIGLVPKRRTAFTVEAMSLDPEVSFAPDGWPMCIDIDEEFYFKPDAGRLLCSPADETPSPPCDVRPEDIDIAIAVERIQAATLLRIDRIEARWAGLRSFVFDDSLVIGPDPEREGFFWMAALGGYGIQTSPATSRLVAAFATGEGFPSDLERIGLSPADLDPDRIK